MAFSFVPRIQPIRRPFWVWLLGTVLVLGLGAIALPSRALVASLNPNPAILGDTISVTVQNPGGAPTVQFRQKTYPMFPLGGDSLRPTPTDRYRALLPTTPLDKPGQQTVQALSPSGSQVLKFTLKSRSFPTQSIWLPPGKDGDISDAEFDKVDAFKAIVTPQKYWQGPMRRPAAGGVTSIYGIRRYYNGVFANDYYHRGVDYGGGVGAPVYAPAAGRIALVGRESQGFKVHGNTIGIDHGQGVLSILIHLSRIDVKPGDLVQAGQTIGAIGSTGASTGPHLHWGLYVNGQSVDPVPWREKGFD